MPILRRKPGSCRQANGQATNPDNDTMKPAVGVYFGDGSSTEGEVHEAMAFDRIPTMPPYSSSCKTTAGLFRYPSTCSRVCPSQPRAQGYGFEGLLR